MSSRTRRDWGPRALFWLACIAAAGATFAAYANHFDNGFHFDDSHVIVNNLSIRSLANTPRFFTDALTFTALPQNAVYRPLLTLSYAVDYSLAGGLVPRQFHRTQFALLLALGGLLVVLYRRVYDRAGPDPRNRWIALAAATWFCMHTVNSETVNYLSSRSSLIATLGIAASFVLYLEWPRGRRSGLYLAPMLLGGLAKPLTAAFAPLLFAYVLFLEEGLGLGDLLRPRCWRRVGKALWRSSPAFAAGILMFLFLRAMDADTLVYSNVDRWTYARTQPFVWLHYARLFVWPRGLTADTDWRFLDHWNDPRWFGGMLFIAGLVALIWICARSVRSRPIAFGLAWFAIALLPTSSIFPLSEVYNEHRVFFPYVGLTAAAVWAVALALRGLRRPRVAAILGVALAVGVVAAHGVGTHFRNRIWRDDESLWRDVASKSPQNGRGLMNYGLTHMRAGRLEEALALYERAATLVPNYPFLQVNLGIVRSALGDPESAERHFVRALELAPDYAGGHYYYARWLVANERAPAALPHLERAVALSPGDADANRLLLELYAATGNQEALVAHARRVLQVSPNDPFATAFANGRLPYAVAEPTAEGLAEVGLERIRAKQWLPAAVILREAVELDPEMAAAWNNLGWALASAGFRAAAIACFERALAIDPEHEHARGNLDWVRRRHSPAPDASP